MGTFIGHVFPGVALSMLAFWWLINILKRYHQSKQKGIPFRSSPTYKCSCPCVRLNNYEVEGAIKLVICSVGAFGEIFNAFEDGKFKYYGNGQHATMFTSFAISGLLDLLRHHKFPVEEEASYAMTALCLAVEGILFKYHLHKRDEIDTLIHMLMIYTIFCNMLAVLAEIRFRNSLLACVSKCYFLLLQGAWFVAVGFIIYNPIKMPKWDPERHEDFLLATMMFTWHALGVAVFIFAVNCLVALHVNKSFRVEETMYQRFVNDKESKSLLDSNSNGHAINMDDDDSESEAVIPITRIRS